MNSVRISPTLLVNHAHAIHTSLHLNPHSSFPLYIRGIYLLFVYVLTCLCPAHTIDGCNSVSSLFRTISDEWPSVIWDSYRGFCFNHRGRMSKVPGLLNTHLKPFYHIWLPRLSHGLGDLEISARWPVGFRIILVTSRVRTHAVAHLFEALRYSPGGRGFDFPLIHWDLSLTLSFLRHYGPGVESACSGNEHPWYLRARRRGVSGRCERLTTLLPSCVHCLEILGAPTSLRRKDLARPI